MYNFSERLELINEAIYNFGVAVDARKAALWNDEAATKERRAKMKLSPEYLERTDRRREFLQKHKYGRKKNLKAIEELEKTLNEYKKNYEIAKEAKNITGIEGWRERIDKTQAELDKLKGPGALSRLSDTTKKYLGKIKSTSSEYYEKIKKLPAQLKDKFEKLSPKTRKTAIIVSIAGTITIGAIITALILKKKAGKQKLVDEIMKKHHDPSTLTSALKSLKNKCAKEEDAESTTQRIDYMIDELSNASNYESCLKKLLDSDSATVILLAASK